MSEPEPLCPEDPIRDEIGDFAREVDLVRIGREVDRSGQFPRSLLRAMGEHHLLGLSLPSEVGGRGLPAVRAARGLFELAVRGGTLPAKLALQPEFSSVLAFHGSPELRATEFAPLLRGERLVANQITEANAGSDLSGVATVAERRGGGFVLRGEKTQAAFSDVADSAIVYARISPAEDSRSGLSAFLVPQGSAGVERVVIPDFGEHWMRRGTIRYTGVPVPGDHLIGSEGQALEYVKAELDHERALLGAIYLGVGWASWAETVKYVAARRVGGRPLARHEAISFPLVEDRARMIAAWEFLERVLGGFDAGRPGPGDAALAKWLCGQAAVTAVDHAMQFHGGSGYSEELPFAQRYRDLRSARLAHGTDEVMHLVAARALWPRGPITPEKD